MHNVGELATSQYRVRSHHATHADLSHAVASPSARWQVLVRLRRARPGLLRGVHSQPRCGTIGCAFPRRIGGMMEQALTQVAQYFLWSVYINAMTLLLIVGMIGYVLVQIKRDSREI